MKSTIHVSRSALANNFRATQAVAGPDTAVVAVVKADAYGHGAALCAPVLREAGATWFGVSDVVEGALVREATGGVPRILVMCGMAPEDAPAMLSNSLTPVVWRVEHLRALQQAAEVAKARCSVHLEIDTGMTRQGCGVGEELAKLLRELQQSVHLECEGVMSHLCCAEMANDERTLHQQTQFVAALQQIAEAGVTPAYIHLANSSAVDEGTVMPAMRKLAQEWGATLMVRPGFALYGHLLPISGPAKNFGSLQTRVEPVLTWTTHIFDTRDIAQGTAVGYGATFLAPHDMRLALLPVGYADGYRRAASSGVGDGWVIIAGQRAPVVGRVSMNLTVVDITEIAAARVGDAVILLGKDVTAEDHAGWAGTIAYDILCGVRGNRVLSA